MADETRVDQSRADPSTIRHSSSRRERAEKDAQEEAFRDYAKGPAASEISTLFARIVALEQKFSRMHGQGGIKVTNGELIEFSDKAAKVDAGGTVADEFFLAVQDEGDEVEDDTTTINFTGEGVTATAEDGVVTVDIPGGNEDATEATYIFVQVQIGGTLEAHEVTMMGEDLGPYTE